MKYLMCSDKGETSLYKLCATFIADPKRTMQSCQIRCFRFLFVCVCVYVMCASTFVCVLHMQEEHAAPAILKWVSEHSSKSSYTCTVADLLLLHLHDPIYIHPCI